MVYTVFLATEPTNSVKCTTSLEKRVFQTRMKIAKSEPNTTREATYA